MPTWKPRVSSGMSTTPPPSPVSDPSSPAAQDPANTSVVNVISGMAQASALSALPLGCRFQNSYFARGLRCQLKSLPPATHTHPESLSAVATRHVDERSRSHALRLHLPKPARITVTHALHHKRAGSRYLRQRHRLSRRYPSIHRRNRMPVRIRLRMPQFRRDPLLKPLADEVLQALRLFMQLVDRVVEHLIQKGLDQTVMPHHFKGPSSPGPRQSHSAMPLVLHQRRGRTGELLQHVRHRR